VLQFVKFALVISVIVLSVFTPLDHSAQLTRVSIAPAQFTAMGKELLLLLNKERSDAGLNHLAFSSKLISLAQLHSRDMATQGKIAHMSSNGMTFSDRLNTADLFYQAAGENIAVSGTMVVEFIHNAFMDSEEHRENILDPNFKQIGIGIYISQGKFYITQDFLQPMSLFTKKPSQAYSTKYHQ